MPRDKTVRGIAASYYCQRLDYSATVFLKQHHPCSSSEFEHEGPQACRGAFSARRLLISLPYEMQFKKQAVA